MIIHPIIVVWLSVTIGGNYVHNYELLRKLAGTMVTAQGREEHH